jgi:hypothetical protein
MLGYWLLLMRVRADGVARFIYEGEMGERRTKRFLMNLGATPAELKLLRYYKATTGTLADLVRDGHALNRRLEHDGIAEGLYDAVGILMAAAGMNEDKAPDVLSFVTAAVDPIALRGGFAYVVDQTGWSAEERARGSRAKPFAGDLIVSLAPGKMFRRGQSGSFSLTCSKDRDGLVTGMSCDVKVVASADGSLSLEPGKWDDMTRARPVKENPTQEKITSLLSDIGRPVRATDIARKLGMETEAIRSALRRGATEPGAVFTQVGKLWQLKPVGQPVG